MARIKRVGFIGNVLPVGVLAVITFKDIPHAGQNVGYISMFGTGLLFADEVTICAGQIIALVVSSNSNVFFCDALNSKENTKKNRIPYMYSK